MLVVESSIITNKFGIEENGGLSASTPNLGEPTWPAWTSTIWLYIIKTSTLAQARK